MATPDRQQDLPRSPGESAFRTWPDGPSPSEAASGFLFGAPAADSAGEEVGHGLVFRSGIWARATQRLWKNRRPRGPRRPTAGSARRRQPRLRPPLRGRHRGRLSLHLPPEPFRTQRLRGREAACASTSLVIFETYSSVKNSGKGCSGPGVSPKSPFLRV